MTVSISHVHIYVDDPDAAVAFYRDTLGLTVTSEVENDGYRWIMLATERIRTSRSCSPSRRRDGLKEDGEALAALLAKGELGLVQFRTDDLETTFEKIAEAPGTDVVSEPTDQFWGVRDAAFRDPSGNLLRIEQAS